jgi:pyruvate carboxylase subunit B
MLERALSALRMSPVPADVRKLMFKVKKKQGTDIARSFDGLNDARNIIDSIQYAKAGGMIAQGTLSITHSEIHTVNYYIALAEELIEAGADEICLKDMAGIGRPVSLGKIVHGIRVKYPDITIQYHGHAGPGFAPVSILEVARAGANIIDVGIEPLSWGTGHVDLLSAHAILKDAGFKVPSINMKAYMQARTLTQAFMDDFLGFFIPNKNRMMNSLLIGPGLPGGMMGSLMADLDTGLKGLNSWLEKNGQPTLSQDEMLVRLFDEVEHIWPEMGYPPLVTPYSQYVKNVAQMNVIQMAKGKERWSMMADNVWDMLLGKAGKLPGTLSEELVALAKSQGRSFFEGHPQSLYPDQLEVFRQEMKEKGWDHGPDEEELLELAMHPEQYRAYKSGEAKKAFDAEIAAKREEGKKPAPAATIQATAAAPAPSEMTIQVNGETFLVKVAYGDTPAHGTTPTTPATQPVQQAPKKQQNGSYQSVLAPLEGKFFLTKTNAEAGIKTGDQIQKGAVLGYIESMKVFNAITAETNGTIAEICAKNGEAVQEDDLLIKIQP